MLSAPPFWNPGRRGRRGKPLLREVGGSWKIKLEVGSWTMHARPKPLVAQRVGGITHVSCLTHTREQDYLMFSLRQVSRNRQIMENPTWR